ncbi:MAG: hypothetical protein ACRBB0_04975 [Pelagimonas sp.]|uniref:hypothetical protein n=1 Tax=Pelagimonas sp. TaxID=2073170 RepID=UPI003D6ADEFB
MTHMMTLLSLYYLCDQAAATRGLTREEVQNCMANYEQLKQEFVQEAPAPLGSPERAAQNRLGYRSFKSWEDSNSATVQELRAQARIRLQHN